jgi:hypothetical protein
MQCNFGFTEVGVYVAIVTQFSLIVASGATEQRHNWAGSAETIDFFYGIEIDD